MTFNPQMLILARESRRMTQKALASASGTSQATVSRSEAGIDRPSSTTIETWASALRYPPALFEQRPSVPPFPKTFLFRKRASLSKTDRGAITSAIEIRQMHAATLARSVELPDVDVSAVTLSRDVPTAAEAARFLRATWRIPPGPITDLSKIVEDHGIVVTRLSGLSNAFSGLSIVDSTNETPPMIFVSADAPGDRDRWTIAHELGHIVMHHHLRELPEECEPEADEFAQEFLMPAHEIRYQISPRAALDDLAQLKRHWRCSMQSILMRGRTVGRIPEAQEKRLWKIISMMGYRRQEPNPLALEETTLISEMIRVHLEDLGYSVEDLARTLCLLEDELRSIYLSNSGTAPHAPTAPRLRLV